MDTGMKKLFLALAATLILVAPARAQTLVSGIFSKTCAAGDFFSALAGTGVLTCSTPAGGSGTVTSVGLSVPGSSLFGVSGSPVTTSGTLGLTTTGTSGGIPYFDTTSTLNTSALLTNHALIIGAGAGAAPKTLAAMTNGQLAIGSTGADPVPASLTSTGATITIKPGAGSINLEAVSGSAGINQLTGDVTAGPGTGSQVATLVTSIGHTWSGVQAFNDGKLALNGSSSGQLTLHSVAAAGTSTLTLPAQPASTQCLHEDSSGNITTTGSDCGTSSATGANPTATAGSTAVNGSAATFMRSDGAPAVATATTSVLGIAKLNNPPCSIGWIAGVNPNTATMCVINQAATISAIIGDVETATGSAATVTVLKAPSGTACSGGTALHSGTFDANGTAATNQTLTVTTSTLSAGDRLCITTTGTTAWTGGTGVGGITVFLAPS